MRIKVDRSSLVFILVLIFSIVFVFFKIAGSDDNKSDENRQVIVDFPDSASEIRNTGKIDIVQATFSTSVSSEPFDNSIPEKNIYYTINTVINLTSDEDISRVRLGNINLSNAPAQGEIKHLAPRHVKPENNVVRPYYDYTDLGSTFESLESQDVIEYSIVEGAYPEYYDEIGKQGGFVRFQTLVYDTAVVDYDAVMERDDIFDGSKLLSYAGFEAGDLAAEYEFDLLVELENGRAVFKSFSGSIDGEKWLEERWLSNVSFEIK